MAPLVRSAGADIIAPVADAEEHTQVQRFWLLVVAGPDTGATYTSSGDRAVIGTYDAADLVLHDSTVSRFHCEISMEGGRPVLRDLGSLNGTSVNGVGVALAHLHGGATLTLGRTQLRFDLGPERVKLPIAARERFGGLVGSSAVMRRVFALLERAAAGDQPILLEGEPGAGKRTAAAAIHAESARARGPLARVDCASLPAALLEVELFGDDADAGALELAAGGTLVLEEIGELPLELQPRLLKAIERREVRRAGRAVPIDARIVAATARSLRGEVNAKKFRSDLYHRLAVLEVRLPPLRERPADVARIVESARGEAPTEELVRELAGRAWPGNVRELLEHVGRSSQR
jgi:two-component system response regulator GlrR